MINLNEAMYRFCLCNPMLNPLGWARHINPKNMQLTKYDNPLFKHAEQRINQNKSIEQIMSEHRVSSVDEIKEFYRNGGRGLRF